MSSSEAASPSNSARYDGLDGLRGLAAVGIVMMHVEANGNFGLQGFAADSLIPSFTYFTRLFMVISAFSLCCGYYDRFLSGNISLERFYSRRLRKIWPLFAMLCTLDLLVEPSLDTLYQYLADLSLMFGLMPNNQIRVMGVGWYIGLVFVFYLCFPFYCFLLASKRRAWMTFAGSLLLHWLCNVSFPDSAVATNIVNMSMFFVAGGLIFLYRIDVQRLLEKHGAVVAAVMLATVLVYYGFQLEMNFDREYILLLLNVCLLCSVLSGALSAPFGSKPMRFLGEQSMQIYLCHMVVFRALERFEILDTLHSGWIAYLSVVTATVVIAIVLSNVLMLGLRSLVQLRVGGDNR